MNWIVKKILGSKNERDLKKMQPLVARINEFDEEYKALSDDQLKGKTVEFRDRLQNGETLEDIEMEAFVVVKNAARRLCGTTVDVIGLPTDWEMVHFDVQLIGGMAIHKGMIAEMATGEGKTLVATLPVYLNALSGKGAHVVTTSDYHSQRDSEWMGHLYTWLGMSVGCLKNMMPPPERLGLGTAPVQSFYSPGFFNLDLSIRKIIRLGEGRSLVFRVDAMNIRNHFNPGNPRANLRFRYTTGAQTRSGIGEVTGTQNRARILALSARFRF